MEFFLDTSEMSQNVLGLNPFYIIWDDWKFYKNSLRFFDIVLKYDRKPMTKQFSLLLLVLLFFEIVWTSLIFCWHFPVWMESMEGIRKPLSMLFDWSTGAHSLCLKEKYHTYYQVSNLHLIVVYPQVKYMKLRILCSISKVDNHQTTES